MQVLRRPLASGETDHELIWLTVSVASLGLAATWFVFGLPWPHCLFHDLTGRPCMTCGMTRSAIQFFHRHFLAAFQWNPLVFAALCGLSIFNAYALIVLVTRARRLRIALWTRAEKKYARIIVITALILNWAYLLLHWRQL
jgi:Protein of unknown function (DUF2752)